MDRMIFVCTGNTCRSPMAEELGKKIALENNIKLSILSRGIAVAIEETAHENAIRALALYDIDLTKHYAKQFTQEDCFGDTLYLTMTLQHKRYLLQLFPEIEGKVFTLKEYAGEQGDIVDPYNRPQHTYDLCAEELYVLLSKILTKLQEEHI